MLRSGRSFFGVRARGEGSKGYAEKGAPTKNLLSRKSLAAASTENRRSANEPAKTLKWAYNSAGRCPRFSPHSVGRKEIPHLSEVVLSTHLDVIRRTFLGHLAQFPL